jgi:glycosyltransferase involved in cell wall biosynthesis
MGRRVLVVEDRAHIPHGHFPVRFAEIAEALLANGCAVELLTYAGWVDAHGPVAECPSHRFSGPARLLARLSTGITDLFSLRPTSTRRRRVAGTLRTVAVALAARDCRRQLTRSGPIDVVSVCDGLDVELFASIAGPGRWLVDVFRPPQFGRAAVVARYQELMGRLARSVERRRRAGGGRLVVCAPSARLRDTWSAHLPGIDVVEATFVGCRECEPIPDARTRLGVEANARVALLFGSRNQEHDPFVVLRTFAWLDGWQLVVCGEVNERIPADAYDDWRGPAPVVRAEFVDGETRDLVHAAADVVVLSLVDGVVASSGRLMDALAWGKPVVCSSGSAAAAVVEEYHLGVLFEPGDDRALADALAAVPSTLDPGDLARARDRFSTPHLVARQLAALDAGVDRAGPVRSTA